MKRSIPHNIENYNEISINELELENLNEKDYLTIRLFIKKYNKKPTIGIVLTIFVGLFYLGITIYNIYLNRLNQKDYWMFVFCAGWFLVALFMYLERGKNYEVSNRRKTFCGPVFSNGDRSNRKKRRLSGGKWVPGQLVCWASGRTGGTGGL